MPMSFSSLHLITQAFYHFILAREEEWAEHNKIFLGRQRSHSHNFYSVVIIAYCYNCSILLLVIVIKILLCQIYKFNFIIGLHVWKKSTVYIELSTTHCFKHLLGVLEHSPMNKGELLHIVKLKYKPNI